MFWKKKDEPKSSDTGKGSVPSQSTASQSPAVTVPTPSTRDATAPSPAAAASQPASTVSQPAPAGGRPATTDGGEQPTTALSSALAAQLGKVVSILMGSPRHQGLVLRDITRVVLPALLNEQYVIAEAKPHGHDVTAPVGLILWARVSDEIDRRLQGDASNPIVLRPEDWRSGDHPWVIDMVGNQQVIDAMIKQLKEGPLKGQRVKMRVRGQDGRFQAYAA